jgi:hypothetical protein
MNTGTNDLRLFEELRLHPWKDADMTKIQAHLAMLRVMDESKAAAMQKAYDDKMKAHIGYVEPKIEPPQPEQKVEPKPKRKKRSPKKHDL